MYLRDARHLDKFMYTLGNELFYEPLEVTYKPLPDYAANVAALLKELSKDWVSTRDGFWFHVHSTQTALPLQGWKIHVSATISNAASILDIVTRIALLNNVPFKFLLDKNVLSMTTSKKWDRGSSGKFITIYPSDVAGFARLLEQLYQQLRDEEGPYILSDKRYKDCKVLYYRYGGIKPTTRVDMIGEHIPVLVSPDGGTVPDVRYPYFNPPDWVSDPFPSEASDSQDLTLNSGKYVIKQALSFSNSGGVYLAEDQTTGVFVVIKEARRYTLQDGRGNDAVTLLKKEEELLELLRGTGIAPLPLESFYEWEHFFLVQENVPGVDIRELMLGESPLMRVNPSMTDTSRFYEMFKTTFKSFANAIAQLHERGIVVGDLSANNIKIDPLTYSVRLIDFEGAFRPGVHEATFLYTPGFRNPSALKGTPGIRDDHYALAAIMLYMIFPIHALSALRQDLYDTVLRTVLADIGWSETNAFDIINRLSTGDLTSAQVGELLDSPARLAAPSYVEDINVGDCDKIVQELGSFILASIQKHANVLFPADPFVYRTNPLSLGFGACGVLYALTKCGISIPKYAFEWLERTIDATDVQSLSPGFLTGSAGIAWTLYELGIEDRAVEFIKVANESPLVTSHHSYLYGMAGIGMANLYLYTRTHKSAYLTVAEDLAEHLLRTAKESDDGIFWETGELVHVGYGYGQSGVALFLLRLHQLSGNERFLAYGKRALIFDLSQGIEIENGVMSFPRGTADFTLDPYLEEGSAGVAKVALRFGMWDRLEMILSDVHRKYSTYPGLLYGLGSFVDVLTDAYLLSKRDKFLEMAKRPLTGLRDIYLLKRSEGMATPGDGLLRVSCDYATGAAGVLRTLYRFSHLAEADFLLDDVAPSLEIPREFTHDVHQVS